MGRLLPGTLPPPAAAPGTTAPPVPPAAPARGGGIDPGAAPVRGAGWAGWGGWAGCPAWSDPPMRVPPIKNAIAVAKATTRVGRVRMFMETIK